MNTTVSSFLSKYNFVQHIDVLSAAYGILDDMKNGLRGKPAFQDMIKTYCDVPNQSACGKSVIVIDAGGTNFRSCLVSFDDKGNPTISDMEKTSMPGVQKELSKEEFFNQIADNLQHLKNKSDRIGFCFSYPMEIQKDGDGVLLGFSKEVKAPEVVGSCVGKELKSVLESRGWNTIKRITLCNDTVAALLAGNACALPGTKYSSYIGYILGTGMNAAYVQPECSCCGIEKQIVVCESGKYNNVNQSAFDIEFDKTTVKPGTFLLEKLCSGAYLGPVALCALKAAAKDGIFSKEVSEEILKLSVFNTVDISEYMEQPFDNKGVLSKIICLSSNSEDADLAYQILDAIVERSSRYAAAILIACSIKTKAGKKASEPICILCNGSTFFKTPSILYRVKGFLDLILTNQLGIYWKIVSCDNDITLGAAISGLIE